MKIRFFSHLGVLLLFVSSSDEGGSPALQLVEEYACFNTIFYFVCDESELAVFEAARFGRNDTVVAALCGVPFTRNCDVDVHFLLNRACAGRRKCSIAVNAVFFGDPCGYEEFLKVTYRCIPDWTVDRRCLESTVVTLYDRGYITSPNYPDKYFMDADCRWTIVAQRFQSIRLTLFDFELDVKRGGRCFDFLEITAGDRTCFRDCGALGKQVIEVGGGGGGGGGAALTRIRVSFKSGQTSLTQRGFLLSFEAIGSGCPLLEQYRGRFDVTYFMVESHFYANVTCFDGFYFDLAEKSSSAIVRCLGSVWSEEVPDCYTSLPLPSTFPSFPWRPVPSSMATATGEVAMSDRSVSIIGLTLGSVTSVLIVTLFVILVMHGCRPRCHRTRSTTGWKADKRSRRRSGRHCHENALNEERGGHAEQPARTGCVHQPIPTTATAAGGGGGRRSGSSIQTSMMEFPGSSSRPGGFRVPLSSCAGLQRLLLRQHPTSSAARESDEDEWQGKDLLDLRCLDDEDSDYIGLSLTFGHQGQRDDNASVDLCPECHPVQRPAAINDANAAFTSTADRPKKGSSFTSSPNLYDTARVPLLDVEEFNSRPDLLPGGRHPIGTDRSESEVNGVTDLDGSSSFVQRKLSSSAPDIIGFGGTSPDDDEDIDLRLIGCEGREEDGCTLQAPVSPRHDNDSTSTNSAAAAAAAAFQSAGETVQLDPNGLDETVIRPTRR